MSDTTPDASSTRSRAELAGRIEKLEETVRRLRSRVAELESDREQLLEENQALRKEVTHARLVDTVLTTLEDESDAASTPEAPSAAAGLHQALPPSFTFRTFFRVAEREGLDAADARRCLRHFLDQGCLTRDGSRLTKQGAVPDMD
jgi:regulator of replication initiation timing